MVTYVRVKHESDDVYNVETDSESDDIDVEKLQPLAPKFASLSKFPVGCKVWYNLRCSPETKHLQAKSAHVEEVFIHFENGRRVYSVKSEASIEHKTSLYEDQLVYAISCPVKVTKIDADETLDGVVVYLERQKGSDGIRKVTYAVQYSVENYMTIESGVTADRIKYMAEDCGMGVNRGESSISINKQIQTTCAQGEGIISVEEGGAKKPVAKEGKGGAAAKRRRPPKESAPVGLKAPPETSGADVIRLYQGGDAKELKEPSSAKTDSPRPQNQTELTASTQVSMSVNQQLPSTVQSLAAAGAYVRPQSSSTDPAAAVTTDAFPSKPRFNSTIRILSGEFAGLIGQITNIKIGGWCSIANPQVTKPIRMSNMEVLAHNDFPPSVVKRDATYSKRKFADVDVSPTSSHYGKRDSSVRRSKRGPTLNPRFHHDNDDEEDNNDEEEVVRPRGRRGRAAATATPSSSSTTTPGKKSIHLCKALTCPKFRQGSCQGYCTTCFKLFKPGAFDSHQQPQRGGSARNCRARKCAKFIQHNCEGYCMKHYREFVLEGGEEAEEEEEDVVSPPKKRARRAIKHEEEEEEEEEEELRDDDDDESLFDATPRTGGSGRTCRRYCKVKRCDKWSQGQPKNGMCFKHFGQYGFGDGTTMTTTKKKRSRSRSSAVAKSPAAVADEIDGEIGVGSLVMVKERMGAGINKPGGVGRVTKVYSGVDDEEVMVYDVKYILGGREKGVDANSLWLHDINAKSPMKPPPSFGGEEDDVAMLDEEEDESIEDDELEGYDEFSFSQLEVPDQSVLDQRALRREEQLNALSGNNLDEDDNDHNPRLEENWECAKCGGLNRPSATSRCTTCQSYRVEKNASEDALLERTRYELLNGNDFWICTSCVIGVPSLRMPCGRCHSSIPFVPLTMPEFEDFVRNQRRIKRKREEEIQSEWDQKLEEISEEWGERKEESTTTKSKKQQRQVEWTKFPCKTLGCKEICAPDCEGFCEDHFRTVIVMEEPEAYPIVCPEDKELITDYFYLAYEQYRPCVLQDWERTRKHKDNKVQRGHPGIACRHCFGRENPTLRSMGRYFPSTENSLYQQTFTSNAVRHLLECPHCPSKVQSKLVSIKEKLDNTPSDGKKSAKFVGEKGGRGKFFRRIWCRLHRLPLDEEEAQTPKKKRSKGKHLSFQT